MGRRGEDRHCWFVGTGTEHSSQGSHQWFPCHSVLLGTSLGYGSREFSPCSLHSKDAFCGNQLVILPSALMKPSKHRERGIGISCRGKNCSKVKTAQAICGLRQLRCSRLSDLPRQLCQGTDTQFCVSQLLDSFLRLQSRAGVPTRL